MSEAVVFQSSVESLKRATEGKLSPAAVAHLRSIGFDFSKPLLSAYPLGEWERATEVAVAELFPTLPTNEARAALGREFMGGFAQTTIGKAMVILARAIGVRRTLSRMRRNMRNGNNYTETELQERGKGHVVLITRMRPEFLPVWSGKASPLIEQFVGVLQGALKMLDAKEASVTLALYDRNKREASYEIRWRE
ncbi:MAG: DUF2378 family protein [Archangium sp.]